MELFMKFKVASMLLLGSLSIGRGALAEQRVVLDIVNDNVTEINGDRLVYFEGKASDDTLYSGSLQCLEYNDPRMPDEGQIYIMNGPSHMGVKALLTFDQCNLVVDKFLNEDGLLRLSWQKEQFEDFLTGNLDWSLTPRS